MSSLASVPATDPGFRGPLDTTRERRPVAVIGTGNVGGELLSLLADRELSGFALHGVANSRFMLLADRAIPVDGASDRLSAEGRATDLAVLVAHLQEHSGEPVIVDLTASDEVAALHADWLRSGLIVVTANKWAAAGDPALHECLRDPGRRAAYRHSTTVGAGLPLLDSISRLRQAGEQVLSVGGLFSGTLTFIMHGLTAGRLFSECLKEAHATGLTEPDPRLDLSGLDVARKLVISARAAGWSLSLDEVKIESLVPAGWADVSGEHFLREGAEALDRLWQERTASGQAGRVPRYVGEVDEHGRARVGVRWLDKAHPFVNVGATDNIFELRTESYRDTPLIIRGPGAGARITAVQVLSDILTLN